MSLSCDEMRDLLESKYLQFNKPEFIETDPIQIPHQFKLKQDIEIAGFFAATLAWGQRPTIIKNANKLLEMMEYAPYDFVKNAQPLDFKRFENFKHRTFNGIDCITFIQALQNIYQNYSSMEDFFITDASLDIPFRISLFKKNFFSIDHQARTTKHLADPLKGSAAKRINMFLRWMVRKDELGVDFGIWSKIKMSDLFCPLDVHSGRVARMLGLLERNQNDWKAVDELTTNLKNFDPNDPVKYDYALFGLGAIEKLR